MSIHSSHMIEHTHHKIKLKSGDTLDASNAVIAEVSDEHTAVFIDCDARGIVELRLVARAVLEALGAARDGDHSAGCN